jgi:hypothetical protein
LCFFALVLQGFPLGRDFGEFVCAARLNVLKPSIAKAWRSSGCVMLHRHLVLHDTRVTRMLLTYIC